MLHAVAKIISNFEAKVKVLFGLKITAVNQKKFGDFFKRIKIFYQIRKHEVKVRREAARRISVLHHFASCNLNNLTA